MADHNKGADQVHPRTRWPDEARDFTPWLAENLDLLGEELGFSLELVGIEKPVGPYFLDILARETSTDRLVAIENQLRWTNTHHLGQLLTYATGRRTKIAIWVATDFCYEHAQALHRLNGWTSGKVRFYGCQDRSGLPHRRHPTRGEIPQSGMARQLEQGNRPSVRPAAGCGVRGVLPAAGR